MKKVFLGGTCNDSKWRDELIPLLKIDYYQPCREGGWTQEMADEELRQRKICDFCLYVITPKMTGVYSVAEVVDDSNKEPGKTMFCFLKEDDEHCFSSHQVKALEQVAKMVQKNGAKYFQSLNEVAAYLNTQ